MIDLRPLQAENGTPLEVLAYLQNFVEALCHTAHEETFFLWTNSQEKLPKDFPRWRYSNVRYIHTDEPNKLVNLSTSLFRFPFLDDIVETEAMRQGLLPWTQKFDICLFLVPCCAPLETNGVKAIFLHDLLFVHFPEFFSAQKNIFRVNFSRLKTEVYEASLIFTPSCFTKNDVLRTFGGEEEKITVLAGGMSAPIERVEDEEVLQAVKEKYALPDEFFLYMGSSEKQKNLPLLLKSYALHRARNGHKSWDLVLAGDVKHQVYGDRRGVYAIGSVPPEDLSALYSLAKALVYPSLFEGFGMRVLEAMAAGCPVISSQFSALPEIIDDSGLKIDPASANAVFRAMQKIFSSPELQEKLRAEGLQKSQEERFVWDTIAEQAMGKIYDFFEDNE